MNEQTRWGKPKFGGSQGMLVALSLTGGAVITGILALFLYWIRGEGELWVYLVSSFATMFIVVSALVWVILVDRNTVRGVVQRPNQSVEHVWYGRAAETVFHIMLSLLGFATGAATVFRWQFDTSLLLLTITLTMMTIFLVSYQLYKRK